MRVSYNRVRTLGIVPIEEIEINLKSRDDIPRILKALKEVWMNVSLRDKILSILEEQIRSKMNEKVGRSGMNYWRLFVLSVLKQGLGCNTDRLCELANNHARIRQMLQHKELSFSEGYVYEVQTVIDDMNLITAETWGKVNAVIVEFGHAVLGVPKGVAR